jgi:hypothetical protein
MLTGSAARSGRYGADVGSGSMSRPRYVRQFGQTWCGRLGW